MNYCDITNLLSNITILYDTREHDTEELQRRLEMFPCSCKREKLEYGDYSCEVELLDGTIFSLNGKVNIERKMGLEEISNNFTSGRERFTNEFEKMNKNTGKMYILIENGSWDKVFAGRYKTKFKKDSFIASLCTWQARYNSQIIFCTSEIAPIMIYKILYYEMREALENMCED